MIYPILNRITDVLLRKNFKSIINWSENGLETQEQLFQKTKSELKNTKIYEDLNLHNIQSYADFVKHITPHDYEFFEPYVERVIGGESDVLFSDKLKYLCVSSGTSGNEKLIPYNKNMIKTFAQSQFQLGTIVNSTYRKILPLQDKQIYYSNLSNKEIKRNNIPLIYLSGLLSLITPFIFKRNFLPPTSVLYTEDFEEKIDEIVETASDKDVRIATSIPLYLVKLFEGILKRKKEGKLIDIWPNLELILYSATPVEKYRDYLNKLIGREVNYQGVYYATEAPLGWSIDADQNYILNLKSVIYSFIVMGETDRCIPINELIVGEKYEIVISSPNGLLQYKIGDVIQVISISPYVKFKIIGRKSVLINVASEKYYKSSLDEVIRETEIEINNKIKHYFLYPYDNFGSIGYSFGLILENAYDNELLVKILDNNLKKYNSSYLINRIDNKSLDEPRVHFLDDFIIDDYFHKHNRTGQLKMKSVFNSKDDYLSFIRDISGENIASNIESLL